MAISIRNRWIKPYFSSVSATSQTPTAGTVYLVEFEVTQKCTVDAISYGKVATQAGNVTVGIYGPVSTEETAAGLAVIIQSASTAVSAGANTSQEVTFTATVLNKGRYYAAIEFDDATNTYLRNSNQRQVVGWSYTYARGGGYGALTDPCPATTDTASAIPVLAIRCSA